MSEIAVELEVGRWIKAQTETATGLTAFLDLIPESQDLPAVKFQVQTRPGDVRVIDQHIVFTVLRFMVVATVQGSDLAELVGYAEDIHEALHRQQGTTSKARILACTRLEPYGQTDIEGADVFRHAGGIYEIIAREL